MWAEKSNADLDLAQKTNRLLEAYIMTTDFHTMNEANEE